MIFTILLPRSYMVFSKRVLRNYYVLCGNISVKMPSRIVSFNEFISLARVENIWPWPRKQNRPTPLWLSAQDLSRLFELLIHSDAASFISRQLPIHPSTFIAGTVRHAGRGPDVAEPREDSTEPLRGDDPADDDEAHPGQGSPHAQGSVEEGRPGRPLRHSLPRNAVRAVDYLNILNWHGRNNEPCLRFRLSQSAREQIRNLLPNK